MKLMFVAIATSLWTVPAAALAGSSSSAPPRYQLHILPTLRDAQGHATTAAAVNEQGVTVGLISHGTTLAVIEAAMWTDPRSQPVIITGEGSLFAMARDINASGQVVGSSGEGIFAFSWMAGAEMDILPMDGPCCPDASAVNDQGVIAGFVHFLGVGTRACLWQGGEPIDLGVVPGDTTSLANDISESGHVVGQSGNQAAMWFNGTATALEPSGSELTMAHGVNNLGEAVGQGFALGPIAWTRPKLWKGGRAIELPLLGGNFGHARAINDQSWIVGAAQAPSLPGDNNVRAALWIDQQPFDLQSLTVNLPPGVRLTHAADINNAGQIVGEGFDQQANFFAFRLDPVSPADLNADGTVDGVDLGILLSQWGRDGAADLNDDGVVNGVDLGALLAAWSA